MHSSVLLTALFAASSLAQGDLAGLLITQPDLSTLLDLVQLRGLNSTLSTATNITIVAPTNQAFETFPEGIPERIAVEQRNSSSVAGLLANHVFMGSYPASAIGEVPTFAQTMLNTSFFNNIQPFTNTTGGQYNGLVANGSDVLVLSGEFTISTVVQADIRLGEGIIIHVIDTVMKFGPTVQQFPARNEDLGALVNALDAAELTMGPNMGLLNAADITMFLPADAAFEAIGSIVAGADVTTLQEVLTYHVVSDNIVFSPSITNTTAPTLQGNDVTLSVFPDGSVFVNEAKVVLPNIILFNGVAHIIDGVLNPNGPPVIRSTIDPSAAALDRVAFADATSAPLPSVTSLSESAFTTYNTPALFTTAPAVSMGTITGTGTIAMPTNAGAAARPSYGIVAAGAGCVAGAFAAFIN